MRIYLLRNLYCEENVFLLNEYRDSLHGASFLNWAWLSPLKSIFNRFGHTIDSVPEEPVKLIGMARWRGLHWGFCCHQR